MAEETMTGIHAKTIRLAAPRIRASWIVYAVLIAGAIVTVVPFVYTILASFKTHAEIIDPHQQSFFPRDFTAENYETIFDDPTLPIERFYFNSILVAVSNVFTLLFSSAVFGFVFAKYQFRYKRVLFGYVLLTMMIPFQLTMIPSYLILLKFDLTNKLWGLILLNWFDAFGIFLMRQFMRSIPDELLDAARVDGATEWQIFFRIVIPQIKPALAAYGTFIFISSWNAYLWPLIVLKDQDVRTLPIILTWYNDRHTSNLGLVMAASVLLVMPILMVYFFFQRWFVRGFTLSGFKG
ncbi:MAG: sugar ABC transporter permease [Chloroflexota bacterium]|nr:MAG: sugar ABC transporter permease [Chloroflexota bacterium]